MPIITIKFPSIPAEEKKFPGKNLARVNGIKF
jgi:hypothetical protein